MSPSFFLCLPVFLFWFDDSDLRWLIWHRPGWPFSLSLLPFSLFNVCFFFVIFTPRFGQNFHPVVFSIHFSPLSPLFFFCCGLLIIPLVVFTRAEVFCDSVLFPLPSRLPLFLPEPAAYAFGSPSRLFWCTLISPPFPRMVFPPATK